MEVGTQAMDHLINILQTDRYADVLLLFFKPNKPSASDKSLFFIPLSHPSVSPCLLNRSDSEILGYALDTLYNIICNDEEEEQGTELCPSQKNTNELELIFP